MLTLTEMSWPVLAVLAATTVGAITDVWKFRVYNALTVPLICSGLLYHAIVLGLPGIGFSCKGTLFGFGILIVPYVLGLMGAGDVKLLAGVGAWLGFQNTLLVFVVSSLVTGVVAASLIIYRGKFGESWITTKVILYRILAIGTYLGKDDMLEPVMADSDRRLRAIPFGAMIPIGVLGALLWLSTMGEYYSPF